MQARSLYYEKAYAAGSFSDRIKIMFHSADGKWAMLTAFEAPSEIHLRRSAGAALRGGSTRKRSSLGPQQAGISPRAQAKPQAAGHFLPGPVASVLKQQPVCRLSHGPLLGPDARRQSGRYASSIQRSSSP